MTGGLLRAGNAATQRYATEVTPGSAGWSFSGLRVLELQPGEAHAFATGADEVIVLPLAGGCDVRVDGEKFRLRGRAGVFAGVTDFAYAPRDAAVELRSEGGGRFALPAARANRRLEARYVPAEDVPVELRGAGRASRQVNNFCAPEAFAADRLIAVEVLTPGGNWSSYPPHKHDEDVPGVETVLEEIYYFEVARRRASATSACTGPGRAARSTSPSRSAAVTSSSCRTATTGRRWRRRATTSTTST